MYLRLFLLICFGSFCFCIAYAQDAQKFLKDANQYYEEENYAEALRAYDEYERVVSSLPPDVLLKKGISSYKTGNLNNAAQLLASHISAGKPDLFSHLFYGRSMQALQKYEQAAVAYKAFLRYADNKHPLRQSIKAEIQHCSYGIRMLRAPSQAFIDNLGPAINSPADECKPLPSPNYENRLYFATNREGVRGGKRDIEGISDKNGMRKLDIFWADRDEKGWLEPQPMPGLLNTAANDYILDFGGDGKVLYYYKGHHTQAGHIFKDTFRSSENFGLHPKLFSGPIKGERGDLDLFAFNDSIILFAARLPGGYGGLDLYYTIRTHGGWEDPVNLGSEINSHNDECSPYLSADGHSLFFSSNDPGRSIGGFDIFSSSFSLEKNQWTVPVNLNIPVNSAANELDFRLADDGVRAYLSSNRKTGLGGYDIYISYLKEPFTFISTDYPIFIDSKANYDLSGNTTDIDSNAVAYYEFPMLYFENEGELTTGKNAETLKDIAGLLKSTPGLTVAIQAHSDMDKNELLFSLYFSLKRAEKVKDYLLSKGVSTDQVQIQGYGPQHPVAVEILRGEESPQGRRFNRRVEFSFLRKQPAAIDVSVTAPIVSNFMYVQDADEWRNSLQGLTYRLQVANSNALYTNQKYARLPHLMVENTGNANSYLCGLYFSYRDAMAGIKNLVGQGFENIEIIPYIDGVKISVEDAKRAVEKHEELKQYIEK